MKCRRLNLLIWGIMCCVLVAPLTLSAREINVRGTVKNLKGECLYRVSIYNAVTNQLVGVTN